MKISAHSFLDYSLQHVVHSLEVFRFVFKDQPVAEPHQQFAVPGLAFDQSVEYFKKQFVLVVFREELHRQVDLLLESLAVGKGDLETVNADQDLFLLEGFFVRFGEDLLDYLVDRDVEAR